MDLGGGQFDTEGLTDVGEKVERSEDGRKIEEGRGEEGKQGCMRGKERKGGKGGKGAGYLNRRKKKECGSQ